MNHNKIISLSLFLIIVFTGYGQKTDPQRQWNMFRGHYASGVLDNANLAENWDASTGENIAWKTKIPGLGHSCPIIWDNNIFITTAVSSDDREGIKTGIYGSIGSVSDSSVHEWKLYCIDKITGEIKWEQTACKGIPEQKRHPMSSHANCTPATNGKYVVAFFGSEGLYCYNMDGELQWEKDFGLLRSNFFLVKNAEWEFASSPLIHENSVIVQCDVAENSFVAAYDLKTGRETWKQTRDEYPGWSTPNIYFNSAHGKAYSIKAGPEFELLHENDLGETCMATPAMADNYLFFRTQNHLIAVTNNQ